MESPFNSLWVFVQQLAGFETSFMKRRHLSVDESKGMEENLLTRLQRHRKYRRGARTKKAVEGTIGKNG